MAKRHYIIYCDESVRKGRFFSNFFGGVLLSAQDREPISAALNAEKVELGLTHEIKWQYVDSLNTDRYAKFISSYFRYVASSRLKVRIMFTQNMRVPPNLLKRHHKNQYYLLYYQFLKHAFGISASNPNSMDRVYFHVMPDQFPETDERAALFKQYLSRVTESRLLRYRNLFVPLSSIAEIDSANHIILQGLDVILGSINARLNDTLKDIPKGKRRRGKRTRAREKLYKHINAEIRRIYPNFNVGTNTACPRGAIDRWEQPYRHWLFMPSGYVMDHSMGKRRTAPQKST